MDVKQKDGKLIITLDMQEPKISSSGKSKVIASSHGNQAVALNVDGKSTVAYVGVNCFVKA